MRISEGIRAAAPLLLAAVLAAGQTGAPEARAAGQRTAQADLDLLRQFHSYAPARRITRKPAVEKQAKIRAALMRKARAAARAGNYGQARKLFAQALEAGEIVAAWYLGYLYRTGRGGKVDHARAFAHYRMLAKRYDPDERDMRRLMLSVDALVRVADYYRSGIGKKREKRDLRRAFRLYSMAAAHNHAGAYYGMAMTTLASGGRIGRPRWAVGWLKRAAMAGHAAAALQLSRLAGNGLRGVLKPDPVAARAWRIIAMRLRGPVARSSIGPESSARAEKVALSEEQQLQALRQAELFLRNMRLPRGARHDRLPAGAAAPSSPAVPTFPAAARGATQP